VTKILSADLNWKLSMLNHHASIKKLIQQIQKMELFFSTASNPDIKDKRNQERAK